ncbi:hypothetical protein QT231_02710 [Halomonas sp. SpR1]|uniref:hypothetical protein n=1 Tax=Halomonas sp. SpR1 TaxID=3050462 RepID=UPI0027E3CB8C|nr:hypothetical protein [Halomonas sp. SpR1]MDQ7731592.1 hypothetical protein [Halomonas sp. SpR1]
MNAAHIEQRAQRRAKGFAVGERPKLASRPFQPDLNDPIDRANAVRLAAYARRQAGTAKPLLQIWRAP